MINSANLPPIVGSTKVGVKIPVGIIRNGEEKSLKVKLGELPDDASVARAGDKPAAERTGRLGFSATDLNDEQKAEFGVTGGVLVRRVVTGPASKAGIRKGDIILSIDNESVENLEHFNRLVKSLPAGKSVALLVQRNGSPTFLALKIPEAD